MVEDYMVLAAHLETLVANHPSLEMMSSRQWTNVCFRFRAEGIDYDEVNTELRDRMMRKGDFMFSRSTINDDIILRPVISNPSVTLEGLSRLIDEIVSTGDEIIRGIPELF
jgi:glutamate/tyrosine decarboxylase-like PLP-dependent enzyme